MVIYAENCVVSYTRPRDRITACRSSIARLQRIRHPHFASNTGNEIVVQIAKQRSVFISNMARTASRRRAPATCGASASRVSMHFGDIVRVFLRKLLQLAERLI